jgi:hypothetical protein
MAQKSFCDKELKTSLVKTVCVKGTEPAYLLILLTQHRFKIIFKVFPLPYFYAAQVGSLFLLQGSTFLTPEDGSVRLSRNVGTKLPLLAAK